MQNDKSDMTELASYAELTSLAARPYDLTTDGALPAARIARYVASAAGLDLLYATQRVDDTVMGGLQTLADEANVVEQFFAMKEGVKMNRIEGWESENRQVLHTASRDIFGNAPRHPEASARAGEELAKLRLFLSELASGVIVNAAGEPFTDLINIGIGGSDLGPRALYVALEAYGIKGRRVHFISNVDPDDAAAVLRRVDLRCCLVNVVSKSGTTLETLANETFVRHALQAAGLKPEQHILAVTGAGSPMDDPSRYLRSFHMFDYIGGRYSATSMVGAVLLGFGLGYDHFIEILRGAHDMDQAAEEREIRRNPPLLQALFGIWNRNFLGHDTVAILPYSQALSRFTAHLQQCDMESNGKSVNRQGRRVQYRTGPIVWGEPGTNGQHAFYQLLHQGTVIVPIEFIGFRKSQYGQDLEVKGSTAQHKLVANLLAQALAFASGQHSNNPNRFFAGNRPSSILMAERLTPYAMGALLAFYEAKIVMQGFVWNINSFDQEGVQLGKVLATRLLDDLAMAGQGRQEEAAAADPTGCALLKAAGMVG